MSEPEIWTRAVSTLPTDAKSVWEAGHGCVASTTVAESVMHTVPVAACALMTPGRIGSIERSSNGITKSSFGFFKLVYTDFLMEL